MPDAKRFKVVLLGNSGVGKSTLLQQYTDTVFRKLDTTIGIDYRKVSIIVENQPVTLDIWDTAGQERFRSLTRNHFRDAQGVILMYSIDDKRSYLDLTTWQSDIERYCPSNTRILIIGNKCDLYDREVPIEHGLLISSKLGAPFMESSAKKDINVRTTFHLLTKMMLDELKSSSQSQNMDKLLGRKIKLQECDCCRRSIRNSYEACCNYF